MNNLECTVLPKMDHSEWLSWRKLGIGASDAPAVVGVSPFRSRYEVWKDKVSPLPTLFENEAMRWGHRLEPLILDAYQERTGSIVDMRGCACESPRHPWARCTLDGFCSADRTIVECKAVGLGQASRYGPDGDSDSLPPDVIVQVQHQLWVTGAPRADVAAFLPQLELRIYTLDRNPKLEECLEDIEGEFWEEVRNNEPPAPESLDDFYDWIRTHSHQYPIQLDDHAAQQVAEWETVRYELSKLQEKSDSLKLDLFAHLDGHLAGVLPDGRVLKHSIIEVKERTTTVKAHQRHTLSVKEGRP